MNASGKIQASAPLTLGKPSPIPKEWKEGALKPSGRKGEGKNLLPLIGFEIWMVPVVAYSQ